LLPGVLALLCAVAWAGFALTAQRWFPHLETWRAAMGGAGGGVAGGTGGGSAREAGFLAVAAAGVLLGLLAFRRPRRGSLACAVTALWILAPFAADLALFPLAAAPMSHGLRTALFVALTELLVAAATFAGWRAAARAASAASAARSSAGHVASGVGAPPRGTTRDAPPEAPAQGAGPGIGAPLRAREGWAPGQRAPVRRAPVRRAPVRRAPLRRALLRTGIVLASVAVTLLLGEFAFRALDLRPYRNPVLIVPGAERRVLLSEIALFRPSERPAGTDGLAARFRPYLFLKGWYDRPQLPYFDAQGCVDYVFDRWGLRDHDFALKKQPGEYRIVAVGDSFTFGVGAQLDDCWTEVLERTLRARRDGPVEVINAGFASGHNPVQYEPWIAKDGVRLQPDVLIVGFCLNDMHRGVEMYAYEIPSPAPVLEGRSVLASFLALQLEVWRHPGKRVRDDTQRVLDEPAQWQSCQDALRRSKSVLDGHGIRLLLVPFPMLSGLAEQDYPYARLMAMVRDFCASAGIECVDLLPDFLGRQDETLWAHPTDQHPNDKAHALIAAGIARHLAQH